MAPRILRIPLFRNPKGRSLPSVPQPPKFMSSDNKTGPQYPAKGGAKITGDPVQGVRSQGALDGSATCGHSQELSPGLRESRATGDSTALVPSTASQPTRRATPVVVGDPPSAPLGPSPPSRSRRERKHRARLAKFAHLTEASQLKPTETSSQPEPAGSSSQQVTEPTGPPSVHQPRDSRPFVGGTGGNGHWCAGELISR